MKTSLFISVIILVAAGIGVVWWYQLSKEIPKDIASDTVRAEPHEATHVAASPQPAEGGPTVDPISLPAFSQREFKGSDFTVGRVLAEEETYTRYYITYLSNDLRISGIMNVPEGKGPFPLLLLNHGHIDTSIYTNGRGLKREQDYLARQGFVVIHSDYRNHAESDDDPLADEQFRIGYAEDVINAITAVKAANLPYIDTNRIGMLGHSMGGGVAWRIAVTQPELVDAFVQFAPVSADERDNFEKWVRRRSETAQKIIENHGEPHTNPEFWDNISPITFFKNISVPVMIHHGTADDSVPLEWSERAERELVGQGKDITLHVYPGEPHEFTNAWPQVMQRTTTFFKSHLN